MGDLKYVKDFEFPSDRGFTGSAGTQNVKGYSRGGRTPYGKDSGGGEHAKRHRGKGLGAGKTDNRKVTKATQTVPATVKKRGGRTKYEHGGQYAEGGYADPGPLPRSVKKRGGSAKRGSTHDKLFEAGHAMGYKRGGYAKDTSGEFEGSRKMQDTMDHGTRPAGSDSAADEEAGGKSRTKMKFNDGGQAKKNPYPPGSARYRLWAKKYGKTKKKSSGAKKKAATKDPTSSTRKLKSRTERELKRLGEKYAKGGKIKHNEGGEVEEAEAAVKKHETRPRPRGHGMKKRHGGAYNSRPMYGKS